MFGGGGAVKQNEMSDFVGDFVDLRMLEPVNYGLKRQVIELDIPRNIGFDCSDDIGAGYFRLLLHGASHVQQHAKAQDAQH